MPILKNPRHEKFAQNIAKGMSAAEAYKKAGYKPNDGSAGRLHRKAQVKGRVAELQNRAAEKTGYTIVKATTELEEARQLAATEKNPAAMVRRRWARPR